MDGEHSLHCDVNHITWSRPSLPAFSTAKLPPYCVTGKYSILWEKSWDQANILFFVKHTPVDDSRMNQPSLWWLPNGESLAISRESFLTFLPSSPSPSLPPFIWGSNCASIGQWEPLETSCCVQLLDMSHSWSILWLPGTRRTRLTLCTFLPQALEQLFLQEYPIPFRGDNIWKQEMGTGIVHCYWARHSCF